MMDWLTTISENLSRLRPIAFVRPHEGGVFIRNGSFRKTLREGWYLCWPVFDQIDVVDIVPQVIDLPNQICTTADNKAYAISGAIEYHVSDVKKFLLDVQNPDESLMTYARMEISRYMMDKEGKIDRAELETDVEAKITKKAEEWGIDVLDFGVNEFAPCRAIRLMGGAFTL